MLKLNDLDLICLRAKVSDCLHALERHRQDLPCLDQDLRQLAAISASLDQQWAQRRPAVLEGLRHD